MFSRLFSSLRSRVSLSAVGAGASVGAALGVGSLVCSEEVPHAPHYHWAHSGHFSAFDTNALRRGFEVYRQICSTCHSLNYIHYRELIGVTHTTAQAKALAASVEVTDGPNDQGEMFTRPGQLNDPLPKPYSNIELARFANGGALPPDLSYIINARHSGEDYVFSILTGYRDIPAGLQLRDGLHYNVYFPGNAISMAKPISDGQIEYEDGTPATETQIAKDVVQFLAWCSNPEHDDRKKTGMKTLILFALASAATGLAKRQYWSVYKTARIHYV